MAEEKRFFAFRVLVAAASLVLLIAGFREAQPLLVPFVFAVFLAVLGAGPVMWMQRYRVPVFLAILIVAVFMAGIFTIVGVVLANSINQFTDLMPQYRAQFRDMSVTLADWFRGHSLDVTPDKVFAALQPDSIFDVLTGIMRGLVAALSNTVLVMLLVIFMLFEAADIKKKLEAAVDEPKSFRRLGDITVDVQRYLGIKTLTSALTGTLVGLWVSALGLQFPFLWGLLAFLMNYIPFVGSILAAIPALLLGLVDLGAAATALMGAGYLVINIGISNALEPIFFGRGLGLSPLVVLLSLVFWGWVWGPAGMLLSVPLTMMAKIFFEHSEDLQWVARLMDARPRAPVADK